MALDTNGNAFTHQGQIELIRRFKGGLYLQTNYTWTKTLDNVAIVGTPQNPYNAALDRGNGDSIRRHVAYTSVTYDLPFGPGKRFATQGGFAGKVIGGWTVASIMQFRTGNPFGVSFNPNQAGWYANRANVVSSDFYASNKQNFNLAEPQVHLAQILTTPVADASIRNLKNDKAQNDDQAKRKMQQISDRLRAGEDFSMLAQNYSEDPGSSANGGDLGFVSESALEKANIDLRRLVSQMQPGQISPVIKTGEGYRILKLLSKEPAGQRELSDPRVQQTIRETLMNRKDQLFRSAFLEAVRNEAHVENYLARVVGQLDPKK